MQKNLSQRMNEYVKEHLRTKNRRRFVTAMACIVIFCTVYELILPAVTMSADIYCGKEEHTHSAGCYENVLICGQEESESHEHIDECYEEQFVCEIEEHTHSMSCHSNPDADIETQEDWEKTIPADLGDSWAENVVAVAQRQLGYCESSVNYEVDDDNTTRGYTRYGAWYGAPYADWDAMFVSFCLNYAGVPQDRFPYEADCADWMQNLQKAGLYAAAKDYTPVSGDIIFFENGSDSLSDHVGIVSEVKTADGDATVCTIEGNVGDKVSKCEYDLTDKDILGYGILPLNCECYDDAGSRICDDDCDCDCHKSDEIKEAESKEDTNKDAASKENASKDNASEEDGAKEGAQGAYSLSCKGEDYEIILTWNEEGVLPENTTVTAAEISQDSEEYQKYYDDTVTALQEKGSLEEGKDFSFARYFDIQLTSDGKSVEPNGTVDVTVRYDELTTNDMQVGTIHFTSDGSEILDATAVDDESGGTAITNQQDSFSVIGNFGFYDAMVTSADSTATGATQATVKLEWADGEEHAESYTITLKKSDDDSTVATAVLSADNSYSYTFTGLYANTTYYVDYAIDGYKTTESATTSASTSWTKASSLSSGNTYVLVYNNSNSVSTSDSSLAQGSVTVSGNTLTSDVPEAMQWKYTNSKLQNASTGTYLTLNATQSGWGWWSSSYTYSWGLGSGTNITYSNNKISSTANNTTRYLQNYNGAASGQSSGTAYTLYQKSDITEMQFTIKAVQDASEIVEPDDYNATYNFEHNKTIDSLNDGAENPDTSLAGQDFYRLYLDMTGKTEPIDLVVVVDASGSMTKTDMTVNGQSGQTRVAAINNFMNGTTGSSYNSDGFVSKFLSMNSENQISVVRFYGPTGITTTSPSYSYSKDSDVRCNWTSTAQYVNCSNQSNNGTNYEAGLLQASAQFEKVADSGHKKVMIFLSDGVPTFYIDDNGSRQGTGVYANQTNVSNCKQPSKDAFDAFRKSNPDVDVYTVGVSEDVTSDDLDGSQSPEVLQYMANNGNGTFYAIESDMSELTLKLLNNWFPYNVSITDKLSKYVSYYEDQPDVKVTMKNRETGDVTTLYENGKVLDTSILKNVYYLPDDTSTEPTGSTGVVRAVFDSSYHMNPNYIYTLSFNVKTTQTAYNEYADHDNSYQSVTGDADTDYGTNATSSNQPGFHSNNAAWVSYTVKGNSYDSGYKHPVVQVYNKSKDDDSTQEEGPAHEDTTPEFEHNKTIDSLNDGVENPDTSLAGQDFYRLYLDMTGKSEPIDLLLVVDGSGSMMTYSDIDGQRRDAALSDFVNGTDTEEGFVSYFLGLNDDNKVSVIQFAGDATYNGDYSSSGSTTNYGSLGGNGGNNISKSSWSADKDSRVLMDWKTAEAIGTTKIDTTAQQYQGTNYEAGLKLAATQFKSEAVAGDGHRKIMLFLSDGAPTYFIIDQNDVGKKSAYNGSSNMKDTDLTASNVGKRYGHGFGTEYADTKEATMQAFDDFVAANPTVTVHTVGVSEDVTQVVYGSGNDGVISSPEVLQYMAKNGGGNYYAVTNSFSTLKTDLKNVLFPHDVTITDMLSKYVRYYGTQPDVKVTMKDNSGNETVLYENGAVTSAASGILTGVTYTDGDTSDMPSSSTGTVKAIFDENYCFDPAYVYTLSFNVKTTQTAYNVYKSNGSNYKDVIGDKETDYGTNTTSSEEPGFHSNTRAYVTYSVDDTSYTREYDHPVIQVDIYSDIKLPETGGIGTTPFYIIGGLLAAAAGVILVTRKRMNKTDEASIR